jgi:hypothetical protein
VVIIVYSPFLFQKFGCVFVYICLYVGLFAVAAFSEIFFAAVFKGCSLGCFRLFIRLIQAFGRKFKKIKGMPVPVSILPQQLSIYLFYAGYRKDFRRKCRLYLDFFAESSIIDL